MWTSVALRAHQRRHGRQRRPPPPVARRALRRERAGRRLHGFQQHRPHGGRSRGLVQRRHLPAAFAIDADHHPDRHDRRSRRCPASCSASGCRSSTWLDAVSFVVALVTSAMLAPIPPAEGAGRPLALAVDQGGLRYCGRARRSRASTSSTSTPWCSACPGRSSRPWPRSVFGGGTITLGLPCTPRPGVGALDRRASPPGWVANLRRQGWAVIIAVSRVGRGHRRLRPGRHAVDRAGDAGHRGMGRRDLGRAAQHHSADIDPRALPQPHVLHPDGGGAGRAQAWATWSRARWPTLTSIEFSVVSGGLACIVGAALITLLLPAFRHHLSSAIDDVPV